MTYLHHMYGPGIHTHTLNDFLYPLQLYIVPPLVFLSEIFTGFVNYFMKLRRKIDCIFELRKHMEMLGPVFL